MTIRDGHEEGNENKDEGRKGERGWERERERERNSKSQRGDKNDGKETQIDDDGVTYLHSEPTSTSTLPQHQCQR